MWWIILLLIFFNLPLYGVNTQRQVPKINAERFHDIPMLWNLESLSSPPAFIWIDSISAVRSLVYESVPFEGKPTSVFAYYSNPDLLMGRKTGSTFPVLC